MSDNLKLPAFPTNIADGYGSVPCGISEAGHQMWCSDPGGFTKLEFASIEIAKAVLSNYKVMELFRMSEYEVNILKNTSVFLAKEVLQEANK